MFLILFINCVALVSTDRTINPVASTISNLFYNLHCTLKSTMHPNIYNIQYAGKIWLNLQSKIRVKYVN